MAFFEALLAQLEADAVGAETALKRVDDALDPAVHGDNRCYLAFIHRLRGEILLKRDPPDSASAAEAFRTAVDVARQQSARSLGLQAALALAKLYQSTGRPVDAHAVLAPALEGFPPTPEMPQIAEAQALLATLAETDEVESTLAQRERRLHLQTAYGQAVMWSKGFAAEETMAAFARSRELTGGTENLAERFPAYYAQWVLSLARGEHRQAQRMAERFLREAEAKPHSPEASVAHRVAGITHWFAGEYREAHEHLEQALALFQPGRDDDLAFRFGNDAGAAASLYLALTLWPLGDVERAASLLRDSEARIADLAHVQTRAHGKFHATMFELMRGDLSRAVSNAAELAELTREHELPLWRARGIFLDGLAVAESGALRGGLEIMRHGIELVREQNVLTFDGLSGIVLAEAEARGGDVDRAVAVLDEALATCERTGHRAFEAELHRVRGEMLLKRDPANPAPAEEALQTAFAVAKKQGTRSFELRAALALAKLYQSTGRPVDAHAILAPLLEGFAPTPLFPAIAEAEALLARLPGS